MYYRVAILGDSSAFWQWKSTVLSELSALFQFLRLYRAPPQGRLRIFSSCSLEEMHEQFVRVNQELGPALVTVAQFLRERLICSHEAAGELQPSHRSPL